MYDQNCGFGTKAIHAGNVKDTQYGALTTVAGINGLCDVNLLFGEF